jgi:hypothetical protein
MQLVEAVRNTPEGGVKGKISCHKIQTKLLNAPAEY